MIWKVLRSVSYIFKICPAPLFRVIWRSADIFDGRFGAVVRYVLISRRLGACGDRVYFGPFVYIDHPSCIYIGSYVSIHNGVTLISKGGIRIGDNVAIAHGSSLVSANHTWTIEDIPIKYNPVVLKEVVIRDDVWIGCGVRVLAGVEINRRAAIAAGAVVIQNVEEGTVYGGVPAKKIKNIS